MNIIKVITFFIKSILDYKYQSSSSSYQVKEYYEREGNKDFYYDRNKYIKSKESRKPSRFSEKPYSDITKKIDNSQTRNLSLSYDSPMTNEIEIKTEVLNFSKIEEDQPDINALEPVDLIEESIILPPLDEINSPKEELISRPELILPIIKEFKINPNFLIIYLASKKNRLNLKDNYHLNLNENVIDKEKVQFSACFHSEGISLEDKEFKMKPLPLIYYDENKLLQNENKIKYVQNEIYGLKRRLDKEILEKHNLKEKILLQTINNSELKIRQNERQRKLDEIFSDY